MLSNVADSQRMKRLLEEKSGSDEKRHPAPLIAAGSSGKKVILVFSILLLIIVIELGVGFSKQSSGVPQVQETKTENVITSDMSLPDPVIFE